MSSVQTVVPMTPIAIGASRRSMDMHGIYEISKILCGPDSLPRILKSTLGVLDSFLDMSTGLAVLLDQAGDPVPSEAGSRAWPG